MWVRGNSRVQEVSQKAAQNVAAEGTVLGFSLRQLG